MDQANGLRSLMQDKRKKLLPEGLSFPVQVFVKTRDISSKSQDYVREQAHSLASSGKRVLLLHEEEVGPNTEIRRLEKSVFDASFTTLVREGWKEEDFSNFGINSILIDAGTTVGAETAYLHSERFQTTLITGGGEKDMLETLGSIRTLSRRLGVKKMDVIVQGLYDSKEAARLFTKLFAGARRLCDADLRYSGAFFSGGNPQARDFLINSS